MKKKLKIIAGFIVLAITIGAFAHYLATHPAVIAELKTTPPLLGIALLGLYLLFFGALVIILRLSVRLFGITIGRTENLLLNAYSSLANFFLPGQSGPVLRGAYLKKRHGMRIKDYMFTAVLYYAFYAVVSALFLCIGSQPWWITLIVLIGTATVCTLGARWYAKRSQVKQSRLDIKIVALIFLATAAQITIQLVIFYLELKQVHGSTTWAQALTYTGAANFALFVSLTPGAIGIREAFLVFSQSLHNLPSAVIVAASVIDRAIYLVLLGVLFVLTISLHAKDKLQINRIRQNDDPA